VTSIGASEFSAVREDGPLVTVVTPSLNQGQFLRRTIDSVLSQSYPHIEYLVLDGGSTDGTLELLESFGDRFFWCSEPDRGQTHAINKGFARARGDIIAWLNADDAYADGAVARAVEVFKRRHDVGLVYGQGTVIDGADEVVGPFPGSEPFSLWRLLYFLDFILQPTAFFRRRDFEACGGLDESLCWSMDWDLWIRLSAHTGVVCLDDVQAFAREHETAKTFTGGWRRIRELRRLVRHHTGRRWTLGLRLYALDTLHRQLTGAMPRLRRPIDRAAAVLFRRLHAAAPDHGDGWLAPRGQLAVPSQWPGFAAELAAEVLPPSGEFTVRFAAAGQALGELEVDHPGSYPVQLALPTAPGASGFRTIDVSSDFSHPSPVDPMRRRSLHRLSLASWG
jgi:glycosyltransferase involved in cell wall biosynthesis